MKRLATTVVIQSCCLTVVLAIGADRATAQTAPITPNAAVGRAGTTNGGQGPFVSSTLPPTGHATRFKRYGGSTEFGSRRPTPVQSSVSPYLNLLRGGDPGLNYHLGVVRDRAIYTAATESREATTQLGGLRRDVQVAPTQPFTGRPSLGPQPAAPATPLKRQVLEQESQSERQTDSITTPLLRDILTELKAIREKLDAAGKPQE
jgi:hypothetical protein